MKGGSQSFLATGARLFVVCAAAAIGLGVVNEITEPKIAARRAADREEVIAEFVGDGKPGAAVPGTGAVASYVPVSAGGAVSGYVLSLRGTGYGGDLSLLAYYAPDGSIKVAKLLDNLETPGLGKRAESAGYMAMFRGTGGDRPVPVTKAMLTAESGTAPGPAGTRTAWLRASRAGFGPWLLGGAGGGGGGAADAVTGATITFTGVSDALAAGSSFVKELAGRK